MRAWLLLLAVLATFHTFVQVASTEDLTSSFITAILPVVDSSPKQTVTTTTTTTIKTPPSQLMQRASRTSALATTRATTALVRAFSATSAIKTIATTTNEISENNHKHLPTTVSLRATQTQSTKNSARASNAIFHAPSESDKANNMLNNKYDLDNNNINNNNDNNDNVDNNNVVIEIKNVEEFDGDVAIHSNSVPNDDKVTKPHRTNQQNHNYNNNNNNHNHHHHQQHQHNQLDVVVSNNQKHSSIKQQQTISHNKPNQQNQHYDNNNNNKHTNSAVQVQQTSEINVQKEQQQQRQKQHNSILKTTTTTTLSSTSASSESSAPSTSASSSSASTLFLTSPADEVTSSISTQPPTQSNEEVQKRLNATASSSTNVADAADEVGKADAAELENNEHEEESEPATYSNKKKIGQKVKPDPTTLVQIENSLLSLFNMKRPPKIDRSKIVIPEAMKELYAQIMGHEFDSVNIPKPGLLTKSANTVRSFTHQDSKIDDRFPHHHRFRLHFDILSIPNEEKLKAAELHLTRDVVSHVISNARQLNRTRYQVLVYDITRVGVRGKREPNYLLLDTKTVRLNSTETVSLDVQPAVDRWLATPKKNFGLLVEVRTMRSLKPAPHHHVRLRRSADEPHEAWQHKQPLLFTYTDDGRHKLRSIRDVNTRSKRAGHKRSHRRKNTEENCRRHSLYVDFSDVGWSDWIVAPPGYDAFYCHGKCPFPLAEHLNSTNHAVVQTLVNNIQPGKVPKACCVPTQLEGISMLYLNDQHTVVLKNYQEMTVVGCGCR